MSYFGRLAARAGGTTPVGLAPANRLASPFARIDQRLNLFVEWGTPLGHGTLRTGAASTDPEVAGGASGTTSATRVTAAQATMPPLHAEPERTPRAPAPLPATAPEHAGKIHVPSARSPEAREQVLAEAVAVPSRAVQSREVPAQPNASLPPRAEHAPVTRESRGPRTKPKAWHVPDSPAPPVSSAEPARSTPDTPDAPARLPEAGASAAQAWQQALDRVSAWMSRSPRPEHDVTSERPEPARPRAPSEKVVERRLPAAAAARERQASPAPRVFEPRAARTPKSPQPAAQPTLTIGSIEVRVVPPAQPPVVVHAPKARAAAAPLASGGRLPSHLTFGLRQR